MMVQLHLTCQDSVRESRFNPYLDLPVQGAWHSGKTEIFYLHGGSMTKATWLKVGGIAGVVLGSAALYLSGTTASGVTAIVGGVFVLAGLIAALFKVA
jgi:hypothetical protein